MWLRSLLKVLQNKSQTKMREPGTKIHTCMIFLAILISKIDFQNAFALVLGYIVSLLLSQDHICPYQSPQSLYCKETLLELCLQGFHNSVLESARNPFLHASETGLSFKLSFLPTTQHHALVLPCPFPDLGSALCFTRLYIDRVNQFVPKGMQCQQI